MISALDSGWSDPGSSPGRGHCVVFSGKVGPKFFQDATVCDIRFFKFEIVRKSFSRRPEISCESGNVNF